MSWLIWWRGKGDVLGWDIGIDKYSGLFSLGMVLESEGFLLR